MFGNIIRLSFAFIVVLTGAVVFASKSVFACEVVDPLIPPHDKPISIKSYCSFKFASNENDVRADAWASACGPALKVGVELVAQKVYSVNWCCPVEQLLVADCDGRQMVLVNGLWPMDRPSLGKFSIELIQAPHGEIALTSKSTTAGIAKTSEDAGSTFDTKVSERLLAKRTRNRFDPYCGFKLCFPYSWGARN